MLTGLRQTLSPSKGAGLTMLLIRVAMGVYLVSSGVMGGLLNIVDPMDSGDMNFDTYMTTQMVVGALLIAGLLTRVGAAMLLGMFAFTFAVYGLNALDQIMILGMGLALLFKGGSTYSLDRLAFKNMHIPKPITKKLAWLGTDGLFLPSVRIAFGANLVWLGFTEKIFAPNMFAAVMEKFHLSPIGIGPDMAVLGAGLIELAIGMMYLLGIRMRTVSVLMFGILVFTVVTFHESILAHIIMFTVSVVFVLNGKDSIIGINTNKVTPIMRQVKNVLLLKMYAD